MLVFIKGRKDILLVLKPTFKEQIWIHRLENAQIANLSLIFEIFRAPKCSKQRNKSLRLLEMLKKPVGNCRNNLSCSSQQHFNLACVQNLIYICGYIVVYGCCWKQFLTFSCTLANGHIMLNTPVLVRSLKLSNIEPSQYLDGWPPGNTGCCWLSFFSWFKTIFAFFG